MTAQQLPAPKTATLCIERDELVALSGDELDTKARLTVNLESVDPEALHFLNRKVVDVKFNPQDMPTKESSEAEVKEYRKKAGHQSIGIAFPQILGYFVIRDENGLILNYQRPSKTGESKLSQYRSIGIGGHCDIVDLVLEGESVNLVETLVNSSKRELEEEIGYLADYNFNLKGTDGLYHLLNNPTEAASAVHVGIVKVFNVQRANLKENLTEILDLQWTSLEELQQNAIQYEPWSNMILNDSEFLAQELGA